MRFAALALLAGAMAGCIQIEEALTVFADGSGKMVLKVGFQTSMLKLMEQGAKQQGLAPATFRAELMDSGKLFGRCEGVAALVPGQVSEDAEWIRSSATAYFDDINKLRLEADKGPGSSSSFSARFSPGSLTFTNRLRDVSEAFQKGFAAKAAERGNTPEQIKASLDFMKPMLENVKISISVTAPGPVTEAAGFMSKEGSTASSRIGADLLIAVLGEPEGAEARRFKTLTAESEVQVRWSGDTIDAERRESFRAEMAEARSKGLKPPAGGAAAPRVPPKPTSLAEDSAQFTDDEVDRLFIDAQLKIARGQIERDQKDKARSTLEGVLKDFPKAKAAQEAKKLLDGLK